MLFDTAYIVPSIGLPVNELVAQIAHRWMLERMPKLVNEGVRQIDTSLGQARESADKLRDAVSFYLILVVVSGLPE